MWKKYLKALLGHSAYRSGAYRWFFRDKAMVVLFHRVDDKLLGDQISCTRSDFISYCEFFKRYFEVVALSELLDRLDAGRDVSRCLVITFDDGYRDNYDVAAPILHRLGLPACFFVITDFIGSNHVPWWDRENGIRSRWMNWDQVRALRARGFEVGAHTCTHPDLTTLPDDEVLREVSQSKARLEAELHEPVELFSYPYGRRDQITPRARELVRSLNLRCCPSAYGGAVSGGSDPFQLMRQPVSPWYLSPWHFGFELLFQKPDPSTIRHDPVPLSEPLIGREDGGVAG